VDAARREQEHIGTAEDALSVVIVEQRVEQRAILGVEQVGVLGSAREDVADVPTLLIAQRRTPLDEERAGGDVIQPCVHEHAWPVIPVAYGTGQLTAHRREPGLLRSVKPSLETGPAGSDVAGQMPRREPALREGDQAPGSEAGCQVRDGGSLVADVVHGGRGPGQSRAFHPGDTIGEVGEDGADAISDARPAGTVDGELQERRRGVDGYHLGAGEGEGEGEGHAAGARAGVYDAVDSVGPPEQIAQPACRVGEPRRLEVGASGEQRAHDVEVDVMRAVGVVTGHVRIPLTLAVGFAEWGALTLVETRAVVSLPCG
jgi:hypothetical protein